MQVLKRFKADQSGTTAVIFGLAFLPLVGMVGGAVDYSRAAAQQTKLQRAVDAVAFALVREPKTATAADIQARASKLFETLYPAADPVSPATVTATRVGKVIEVSSNTAVRNAFVQVLGLPRTQVAASAKSTFGSKIEVALVLDNTGSMDDLISGKRKIDELKSSASQLLTDLRALADEPDTVKVSIVPFDTEVRLDASASRNKDWFRWSNPSDRLSWTGYVYDRWNGYASTDGAPDLAVKDSLYPAPRDTEYRTNKDLMELSTGDLAPMRPLTSLYAKPAYDDLQGVVGANEAARLHQHRARHDVGSRHPDGFRAVHRSRPGHDP